MRRPVKPFSVEVRRSGRRAPQPFIAPREVQTPREVQVAREAREAPQPDYFTPRAPTLEPQPTPDQSPPRRVLQDLNEPRHDPLTERLQQLESRLARRGRPPGSKNKVQRPRPRAAVDLSQFFETPETPAAVVLVAFAYKRRPPEQRW
jgi:hypothetical protein